MEVFVLRKDVPLLQGHGFPSSPPKCKLQKKDILGILIKVLRVFCVALANNYVFLPLLTGLSVLRGHHSAGQ